MRPVNAPPIEEDDAYLTRICQDPRFNPYYSQWSACYANYRTVSGNPWNLAPASFPSDVGMRQRQLYDNRKNLSRFVALRGQKLSSCPMCGSPVTGTLDHFLPKEIFPEFAVMAANLVPACMHCNSGGKGRTYYGSTPDEWFFHPYFDAVLAGPLWQVRITAPYEAATFEAVPRGELNPELRERVAFQLRFVLGDQFQRATESMWVALPENMKIRYACLDVISVDTVRQETKLLLLSSAASTGPNSWQTAFYRGLLSDGSAQCHVADLAMSLTNFASC